MNFKKIWSDPVWSKVISAIIIALAALVFTYISAKLDNSTFQQTFLSFLYIKISLWLAILIFFTFTTLIEILRKRKKQFKYDIETLKLDKETFEKLKSLLPQNGSINQFRSCYTFLGFDNDEIDDFRNFKKYCNRSDFEFFHPNLENLKLELLKKTEIFTENFHRKTAGPNNNRHIIPSSEENPEKYEENKKEFETSAKELIIKYDDLIKLCRTVLKV